MSLTSRILGAAGCLAAVALATGTCGVLSAHSASASITELSEGPLRWQSSVRAVDLGASRIATLALNAAFVPGAAATSGPQLEQKRVEVKAELADLQALVPADQKATAADLQQQYQAMETAGQQILAATDPAVAQQANAAYDAADAAFGKDVATLSEAADAAVASAIDAGRAVAQRALLLTVALMAVGFALSAVVLWVTVRRIRSDVGAIVGVARSLEDGDLTAVSGITSSDELGRAAGALDRALAQLRRDLASVSEGAGALQTTSASLARRSDEAGASTLRTSRSVEVVAEGSSSVTSGLAAIGAGADEMSSAIQEISASATDASGVAAHAVRVADETTTMMSRLSDSSAEIGSVVKVITAIAEQTNLLALNATIEAARAGELGKGFAVVAGEVKELARQTADATEDISRRVHAIQGDTTDALAAMTTITDVISRINELQTTIAAAVEEQTATTMEISRSITEAAAGADRVDSGLQEAADATRTTVQTVSHTEEAARQVAGISTQLEQMLSRFRY